jgi:RimJ/RimL family protein N-acetyltransferase
MLLGSRTTLGAFVPDDYVAMYCWANDIVAARLDRAFRPTNLRDVVASCEIGGDASRVMFAIRQRTDPKIIGYINIHNISAVHRSADLGIRIGDEKHRGQGLGKEALAMALDYCWNHLNLERVGLVASVRAKAARTRSPRLAALRTTPQPPPDGVLRQVAGRQRRQRPSAIVYRFLAIDPRRLFALLEQRLEGGGITASLGGSRIELLQPVHDPFIIGAELLRQRVGLGAEGGDCFGVLFLLRLLHLFLELADIAISLQLGFVGADRLNELLHVGHRRLRHIRGRRVLLSLHDDGKREE